jgi:glycerophosphoryl diester phosphodiesterase
MTRPKPQVVIAAHRGMAAGYPENTLAAFRHSASAGFPVIEVDLRATADGHIVIMHDETVDRTTDGTGEAGRMTLAEIRSLDAGSHAGPQFAGEPVPTCPETLQALRGLGATLILDIKQEAMPGNEHVVRLAEEHREDAGVIVAARSITDLLDYRRLSPGLRTRSGSTTSASPHGPPPTPSTATSAPNTPARTWPSSSAWAPTASSPTCPSSSGTCSQPRHSPEAATGIPPRNAATRRAGINN